MAELFDLPPLPTEDEYSRAALLIQERMLRRMQTAQEFLLIQSANSPSSAQFSETARTIGLSIEPLNESNTGFEDDKRLRSRALWMGALGGFVMLQEAHQRVLQPSQILTYAPKVQTAFDLKAGSYSREALQEEFTRVGNEGIALLGRVATTFISRWGAEVVRSHEYQSLFAVGAGITTLAARGMHQQRLANFERRQMEDLVSTAENINWDDGLQKLLSEE